MMSNASGAVVSPRLYKPKRKILLGATLFILAAVVINEYSTWGLARRSFVFYASDSGNATVEERMLRVSGGNQAHSLSREVDLTRYVEEALLGPISPNLMPLFPKETRLQSLLYRDGTVYVSLSEDAALPPLEGSLQGKEVFTSMETLNSCIKRNFPYVRDVRFFIGGNAAYAGKFR
ncbi:MAG: GerMN domain-containing protein [Treponema sp.]|nr:GerMN domain-containing protein [Treponema sp.]